MARTLLLHSASFSHCSIIAYLCLVSRPQAVQEMVRASQALDAGCTTREYVDAKWSEELRRQSMDEVGMRDYALDDMGAQVVHGAAHTSATYTAPGAILSTDAKKKVESHTPQRGTGGVLFLFRVCRVCVSPLERVGDSGDSAATWVAPRTRSTQGAARVTASPSTANQDT